MKNDNLGESSTPFKWGVKYDLSLDTADKLGLCVGVLAREGTTKSGDEISMQNIIEGAGGMRALSLQNQVRCDIDHERELPRAYDLKYEGLKEAGYPVGDVIDVRAAKGADGKWQVEGLFAIHNSKMYGLIKEGLCKGISVDDIQGNRECSRGTCKIDGSTYWRSTFMLEGVPQMDGTWVRALKQDDIGTVITGIDHKASYSLNKIDTVLESRLLDILKPLDSEKDKENPKEEEAPAVVVAPQKNQSPPSSTPSSTTTSSTTPATVTPSSIKAQYDLQFDPSLITKYYDIQNSKWLNENSAIEYLEAKMVVPGIAKPIAEYIIKNPNTFTNYQLACMSGADFTAWWNHNILSERLTKLEKSYALNEKDPSTINIIGGSDTPIAPPNPNGKNAADEAAIIGLKHQVDILAGQHNIIRRPPGNNSPYIRECYAIRQDCKAEIARILGILRNVHNTEYYVNLN